MPAELAGATVAQPQASPDAPTDQAQTGSPASPAAAPPALPPPFSLIAAGQLPAVTIDPHYRSRGPDPIHTFLLQNWDSVEQAGIQHEELDSKHTVFYNPAKVSPEAIQAAYKKGELHKVAPSVHDVAKALLQAAGKPVAGAQAPLAGATVGPAAPQAALAASTVSPGAAAPVVPAGPPVPMDRRLQGARIEALKPVAPGKPNGTVNQLAKRAV